MFPGSRAGKTHILDQLIGASRMYETFFISTKPPHDIRPAGKIIQGEVIREYPAIEAAPDAR